MTTYVVKYKGEQRQALRMRPTPVLTTYVYFLQGRLASLLANHSFRRGVCPRRQTPPPARPRTKSKSKMMSSTQLLTFTCKQRACFLFLFTRSFWPSRSRCQRHSLQTFLQHGALVHDHRWTSHAPRVT
eukprot:9479059-Pyramimonas_sp.AAC.1